MENTILKLFPKVSFLHGDLALLKNIAFTLLKINAHKPNCKVFYVQYTIVLCGKRCNLISSFSFSFMYQDTLGKNLFTRESHNESKWKLSC